MEYVPERFHPYVHLARLDRPIGVWLLLLPGWWGILLASAQLSGLTFNTVWLMVLFGVGAIVMRAAGCVINDLWDRNMDAEVERTKTRPLASGDLTVLQGVVFLGALLFLGFCILMLLNGATIILGLVSIPLVILYPLAKRFTDWPQAVLGLTFNFGALMGWTAVMGGIGIQAILLYAAGFFWTMGYDTIYAHQDKEDDALIGVRSTALKFGDDSKMWVSGFYAVMLLCLATALSLSAVNLIALPGLAVIAVHLFWQMSRWDPDDNQSSLKMFQSNRDLGLIVLGVIFLGGF